MRQAAHGSVAEESQTSQTKEFMCNSQDSTLRTRSKRFNVSDTRRNPSGHFQLPVKPIIHVRPLWLFARATSKCG